MERKNNNDQKTEKMAATATITAAKTTEEYS